MTVWEFEQKVWNVDSLRIIIRAPQQAEVGEFDWVNAASGSTSISKYCALRVSSRVGDLEYFVADGTGQFPNGNTHINKIRDTYNR